MSDETNTWANLDELEPCDVDGFMIEVELYDGPARKEPTLYIPTCTTHQELNDAIDRLEERFSSGDTLGSVKLTVRGRVEAHGNQDNLGDREIKSDSELSALLRDLKILREKTKPSPPKDATYGS